MSLADPCRFETPETKLKGRKHRGENQEGNERRYKERKKGNMTVLA
jgi:hypothetical protein